MVPFKYSKEYCRDVGARFFWVIGRAYELLIEITRESITREDTSIVFDQFVIIFVLESAVDREFSGSAFVDELTREDERWEIWIWEVAIIHGIFLGPQWCRVSFFVIPSTSFLIDRSSIFVDLDLTSILSIDRTTD